MSDNDLDELKAKVEKFLQQQSSYKPGDNLKVVCDEGDSYFILHGPDVQVGVVGFGMTASAAYNDFVDNWTIHQNK